MQWGAGNWGQQLEWASLKCKKIPWSTLQDWPWVLTDQPALGATGKCPAKPSQAPWKLDKQQTCCQSSYNTALPQMPVLSKNLGDLDFEQIATTAIWAWEQQEKYQSSLASRKTKKLNPAKEKEEWGCRQSKKKNLWNFSVALIRFFLLFMS